MNIPDPTDTAACLSWLLDADDSEQQPRIDALIAAALVAPAAHLASRRAMLAQLTSDAPTADLGPHADGYRRIVERSIELAAQACDDRRAGLLLDLFGAAINSETSRPRKPLIDRIMATVESPPVV